MIQNIWEPAKEDLRGKIIVIKAYLQKQGKLQINNQTLHLKELEKEEQSLYKEINHKDQSRNK